MTSQVKEKPLEEITPTRYGRLTVLSYSRRDSYKTAICRCECGNEKEILLSNLKAGRTKSCGCLEKENQEKYRDLSGQRFGHLVAVRPSNKRDNCGSIIWWCKCDCGKELKLVSRQLLRGYKKDCGCVRNQKFDISGQKFGMLEVIKPLSNEFNFSTLWLCKCECGRKSEVNYGNLSTGHTRSCGCLKEVDNRTYMNGTIVESLKAKLSKRNTSGYKGVYRTRNKWAAYITFAKKRYHLGCYVQLSEAVRARKEAEKIFFEPILVKASQLKQEGKD